MYHAYAGDRAAADAELKEALRLNRQDGAVLFRAVLVHEQLGRRDQALAALRETLKQGYSREELGRDPALDELRKDPRYALIAAARSGNDPVR